MTVKTPMRAALVVLTTLAFAPAGCGGGGGGGTTPSDCLQFQPCGGDVVGTWLFDTVCSDPAVNDMELAAQCGGNADRKATGVSGMLSWLITFAADGTTMSGELMESFHSTQIIPLSCTTHAACADIDADLTGLTSTATCTGTSTCTCDYSGTLSLPTATGTWSTSGTTLVLDNGTGDPYCVAGNRLHVMTIAPTAMGPTGEPLTIGALVGTKQ
jgi:hypothetical protein